jgi:hypothetical protein
VIVAGGGPAGVAAATAAARNGAEVLLVERYGHLGGLATGGLVICLVETKRYGYGICKEVLERLSDLKADRLNTASGETERWVEGASLSGEESYSFDPEAMKFISDRLVVESGANLLLHSLVVAPIVRGNDVKGLVLEGKLGRQAVLAKVIVDATGDADIAAASGAPYEIDRHPWGINLEFRLGNVDVERATKWREQNPKLYAGLMDRLKREAGEIGWGRSVYGNVAWCHGPHFFDVDGLNTRHLTRVEVESRRAIMEGLKLFRENLPGFEDAFIMDTAPQIGVRETRRIVGEYVLTKEDALAGRQFDDAVAKGIFGIPYRCLVPKGVDGLLVAGRCISTTHEAQGVIRNIPPCLITGQAAGIAAALAAKKKVKPRKINVNMLKGTLKEQGIKL